ncbi:poly(ADP-ribose) glycohydrolase domain-containing protein [Streptomyces spongiicola]|uniref:poly(ADP-ribose) glycohydrolase domain-containing protein n=1 Tax=Streptomyces spongiicola TaxID=1690221 RepID=UPI0034060A03
MRGHGGEQPGCRAADDPAGRRPGGCPEPRLGPRFRRVSRASPRTAIPAGVPSLTSDRDSGGGCLNGAHAQEEALCRASALHTAPPAVPGFDAHHREVSAPLLLRSGDPPAPGACSRTRAADSWTRRSRPGSSTVPGPAPGRPRGRRPSRGAARVRRAARSGGRGGPVGGTGEGLHRPTGAGPAESVAGRRVRAAGPGHRRADMRDGPGLTSVRA